MIIPADFWVSDQQVAGYYTSLSRTGALYAGRPERTIEHGLADHSSGGTAAALTPAPCARSHAVER